MKLHEYLTFLKTFQAFSFHFTTVKNDTPISKWKIYRLVMSELLISRTRENGLAGARVIRQ